MNKSTYMINRIYQKLKLWWNKLFVKDETAEKVNDIFGQPQITPPPQKSFRIIKEEKIYPPIFPVENITNKTFEIENEQQITNVAINIDSNSNKNSRFKTYSKTRPKQCKFCLSENQITRLESGEWQCKVCGKSWK